MLQLGWPVVLVGAKQANIQIVTGVLIIIRIAAEKRRLLLRGKNQPHIGVFFVTIKMILCALVERDDVAAQAGFVERLFFNLGLDRTACGKSVRRRSAGFDRSVDPRRHILDRNEHVQLQVDTPDFLGTRFCVKPIAHVVVLRVAQLLQVVGTYVVVSDD